MSSDTASWYGRVGISLWTAIAIDASGQRESPMIFAASWAISARLYNLIQRFAPSNVVIRRIHTRTGLKWGSLAGLGGVAICVDAQLDS